MQGSCLWGWELCVRVMSDGRPLYCWCWTYMSCYLGVNALVAVLFVQWNHHLMCCHKVVYLFNLAHFSKALWNSNDLFIYLTSLFLFSLFVQSSTISLSCQLGSLTRTKSVECIICYAQWVNVQFINSILIYVTVTSRPHNVTVVLLFTPVFLQIKYYMGI
jgi:hypothetical protein